MDWYRVLFGAGTLTLAFALMISMSAGASSFGIKAGPAIDIPPRTVELENQDFTVHNFVKIDTGDTISTSVTAPSETVYRVYLYNSERDIVLYKRGEGSDSFSLNTDGLDAGSYVIAVKHDGDFKAIEPVVIRGYAVSISAPSSAQAGSSVEVSGSIEKLEASVSSGIELFLANDERTYRADTTADGNGEYQTTIEVDEPGDYRLYATVKGGVSETGDRERLGVSQPVDISITASTTSQQQGGGGVGGGGGGGGFAQPPATTTSSATPTSQTPTPATTTTSPEPVVINPTTSATTDESDGQTVTARESTNPQDTTATNPTQDDGRGDYRAALTPNKDGRGTGASGPLSPMVVLAGILGAIGWLRFHRG